ncbi:MAG TPA: class I SAM-dependent methyltransferase [Burkholderiales bacterium]
MLGRLFAHLLRSPVSGRGALAPDATPPQAADPIAEYYFSNRGRLIYKWHHYFEIYHRHFEPFRGRSPVVVEIGVFHGGSLQMWRHYFGPGAHIVGIDVDPRCKQFEDESTTILIGDQADRRFLAEVRERVPHIDILIDDGGHTMTQQIVTFEELYPHIQPNGIYLCEDIHTSFFPEYGGGYRREGTFLEYSKALIDRLYGWYSKDPALAVDELTRTTFALHFYDSVLVMEKRPIDAPQVSQTGQPSF